MDHGKCMGKPIRINLPFKCEQYSMEYRLEVFPNRDANYIDVRVEPQYYSILTITLLSAKKEKETLVMNSVKMFSFSIRTRNDSSTFTMMEEREEVKRTYRGVCGGGGGGGGG